MKPTERSVKILICMLMFSTISYVPYSAHAEDGCESWCVPPKHECVKASSDGKRNGVMYGTAAGAGVGGGLCAAGVALAALTWGISAVVGCSIGAVAGAGTGAYVGAEMGETYDYQCVSLE